MGNKLKLTIKLNGLNLYLSGGIMANGDPIVSTSWDGLTNEQTITLESTTEFKTVIDSFKDIVITNLELNNVAKRTNVASPGGIEWFEATTVNNFLLFRFGLNRPSDNVGDINLALYNDNVAEDIVAELKINETNMIYTNSLGSKNVAYENDLVASSIIVNTSLVVGYTGTTPTDTLQNYIDFKA